MPTAKRPSQLTLTIPPALLQAVDEIAKTESTLYANRSAVITEALYRFVATKRAACCQCGKYGWIAGYTTTGPLCDECM